MIPVYIFWLALVIAFGIAEAATLGLTSIWFAVGALAAMVFALFQAHLLVQIAVFVLVSALCLWLTRKKVQARFNKSRQPTNADRILGQQGRVLEAIDNSCAAGAVKVDGKVWSARSAGGQPIPAGAVVTIRSIEGVKVLVTPVE